MGISNTFGTLTGIAAPAVVGAVTNKNVRTTLFKLVARPRIFQWVSWHALCRPIDLNRAAEVESHEGVGLNGVFAGFHMTL